MINPELVYKMTPEYKATLDDFCTRVRYEDGALYYTSHCQNIWVGKRVGCIDRQGYRKVDMWDKTTRTRIVGVRVARIIFYMHHGYLPVMVDHIDRIRGNDRIENLRPANNALNQANKLFKLSKSGYRGVRSVKGCGMWQSQIGSKKRARYLGTFKTAEEAAHAYNKAAILAAGEFAVLNAVGVDPRG